MALTDDTLNLMGLYLETLCTHASLHTAAPNSSGSNESSAGRQAIDFNVDADGDLTLTVTENFTGGASNGACTHVGLWSASSGGTFRGSYALTGDQVFNAAGEYSVTGITIVGTAS